jgi:hypothetical protein
MLINKILKHNTSLDDIAYTLEDNNLTTVDFFIAIDYKINSLPWVTNEGQSKEKAKNKYIELMRELSQLNSHLVNKILISEDDSEEIQKRKNNQKIAVQKGICDFDNVLDKYKDNLEKYKEIRKKLLGDIDYCKPIIELLK